MASSFDPYDDARIVWTLNRDEEVADGRPPRGAKGADTGVVQTLEAAFIAPRDPEFWTDLSTGTVVVPAYGEVVALLVPAAAGAGADRVPGAGRRHAPARSVRSRARRDGVSARLLGRDREQPAVLRVHGARGVGERSRACTRRRPRSARRARRRGSPARREVSGPPRPARVHGLFARRLPRLLHGRSGCGPGEPPRALRPLRAARSARAARARPRAARRVLQRAPQLPAGAARGAGAAHPAQGVLRGEGGGRAGRRSVVVQPARRHESRRRHVRVGAQASRSRASKPVI